MDYRFTCGWCNCVVGPYLVWPDTQAHGHSVRFNGVDNLQACANCKKFTLFAANRQQYPSPSLSKSIDGLDLEVSELYQEAGRCLGIGAYTAVVMLCRTLLMHSAISKSEGKLDSGKTFAEYVDYLEQKRYITPDLAEWAGRVRKIGNDAAHKLQKIPKKNAEDMFEFITLLLIVIFGVPYTSKEWNSEAKES